MSTTHPTRDSFRPSSYWEEDDPLTTILRNVKGTNRRQMITDFWNAGQLDELDPAHLEDETDPGLRRFLESIDPSFMGGEYLPDFLPTEVEIVRIELKSTTSDVISIRARYQPGDELIHYRVVDEYGTTFEIQPESSTEPLSHDEIVRLLDTTDGGDGGGLGLRFNHFNFDVTGEAERLRYFTTVRSDFYPDLFDHYDEVHERWAEENSSGPDEAGGEE